MASYTKFFNLLSTKGFYIFGTSAATISNGFVVTVTPTQNLNYFTVTYATNEQIISKEQVKQVKSDYKAAKGKRVALTGVKNQIESQYFYNNKPGNDIEEHIEAVTNALRANQIVPNSQCSICQTGNCDCIASVSKGFGPTHESCVNSHIEQSVEAIENKQYSYVFGIIGALLGAIIGIIPSVITILVNETIYSLLFMLIPLAIFEGYKLFKGKLGIFSIALTVVLSLVAVPFMQFAVLISIFMASYEVTLVNAIKGAFIVFSDPGLVVEIIKESYAEFIFIAIGVFAVWKRISLTEKGLKQEKISIAATIIPLAEFENNTADRYEETAPYESYAPQMQ